MQSETTRPTKIQHHAHTRTKPPNPPHVFSTWLTVKSLQRTRILNIHLGDLPNGKWRDLTEEELDEMFNMMNYEPKR